VGTETNTSAHNACQEQRSSISSGMSSIPTTGRLKSVSLESSRHSLSDPSNSRGPTNVGPDLTPPHSVPQVADHFHVRPLPAIEDTSNKTASSIYTHRPDRSSDQDQTRVLRLHRTSARHCNTSVLLPHLRHTLTLPTIRVLLIPPWKG